MVPSQFAYFGPFLIDFSLLDESRGVNGLIAAKDRYF